MDRRRFLQYIALTTAYWGIPATPGTPQPNTGELITKEIPSSGKSVPVIGMGTWITFDVGQNPQKQDHRTEILREFFKGGGAVIDSSPMYGSSEATVGYGLEQLDYPDELFSATKVWTSSTSEGLEQIEASKRFWGVQTLDLEQVHNLRNWEGHLENLFELKEKGDIGHVGVTTYGGYRHSQIERIMDSRPIDFIQLTYNIENRKPEERLLGVARDRGIAVIANRPFGGGPLIDRMQRHPLPSFAAEMDCDNWPQLLLKFIVSHPSLTCAIPATTQIEHMRENMGACHGRLLEQSEREQIISYISEL